MAVSMMIRIGTPFPKGWDLFSLRDGDLQHHTSSELQAFLQAWLYLGSLCHLLQETFASLSSKCVRVDVEHGPVIDSQHLPQIFERLDRSSTADQKKQTTKLLWSVADICGVMTEKNIICPALLFSIALLNEGLSAPLDHTPPNRYVHHALQLQMQAIECCPTLFQNLISRLGISGVYLRILMGKSSLSYRHFVCDSRRCNAFTVSKKTYQVTHARNCRWRQRGGGCDGGETACPLVEVNHEELLNVLRLNTFPIAWIDTEGQTPVVRVRPFEEGMKYVAISHVIADGMGNFTTNGILQCRLIGLSQSLARIRQILINAKDIPSNQRLYFWLDTYCVPNNNEEGRKTALQLMSKSYQAAYLTLVLDDELRQTNPLSDTEAAISVTCSAWATRLWTLEEVVLARKPVLQFAERLIDLKNLSYHLHEANRNGYQLLRWCKAIAGSHSRLGGWTRWDLLPDSATSAHRYTRLLLSAEGRSTSVLKDEPICLSGILGTSTKPILNCRLDRRMHEFWRSQINIPKNILYLRAPRLQEKGLRWAPSTLLGAEQRGSVTISMGEGIATLTDNGLDLANSAFRFASPGRTLEWPLSFRLPNGLHYQIIKAEDELGYNEIAFENMTSLAVLYRADSPIITSRPIDPYGPGKFTYVALVNLTGEDENRIKASYLGGFTLLCDQRPMLANVASTCVEGVQIEAQWRIS